jgi:broad specificity phosphatase PhoE
VDADLSDTRRIEWLRTVLPHGALFSSDLRRAVQTADALKRGPSRQRRTLRETNFGAWEGLSFTDIMSGWSDLSRAVWEQPGAPAPPEGESWNTMSGRVVAEIETLKTTGGDLVVVAHHGPILAALAHATGLPPERVMAFEISNLSVTRLDWLPDAGVWRVGSVNQHP